MLGNDEEICNTMGLCVGEYKFAADDKHSKHSVHTVPQSLIIIAGGSMRQKDACKGRQLL